MNIDVESTLVAAERVVSSMERDGQPARAVTLSRNYRNGIEDIWDAVTSSDRIPRWFLPVSGDLKLGGRYQLEGNAGGLVTACSPPSHFSLTWEIFGDVSWVDLGLQDLGADEVHLSLTHTAHLSEHWNRYGPGAVGVGWELALLGLGMHLDQPDEPMPEEVAFATSLEGRALITGSSERWAQAAVSAGAEPDAALDAARRTSAFYTGEPEETA